MASYSHVFPSYEMEGNSEWNAGKTGFTLENAYSVVIQVFVPISFQHSTNTFLLNLCFFVKKI